MKKNKIKNYRFGKLGEWVTQKFLLIKGYRLIALNYKSYFGEIDIVAKKGNTIVFVEVKTRKKNQMMEIILSSHQVERIKRAAEFFIAKNPCYQNCKIRFDLVLISKFLLPTHHRNFWN